MDLPEDIFKHIFCFLPIPNILLSRLVCHEMKHWIDTSPIWQIRLKEDFNIVETVNQFEIYKMWYRRIKDFYFAFQFSTPQINKFLELPDTTTIIVANSILEEYQDIEVSVSYPAHTFIQHLSDITWNGPALPERNYFDSEQLEKLEEYYNIDTKKLKSFEMRWKDIIRRAKNYYDMCHFMSGIITILDEDNLEESRKEKLIHIIKQQNKLLRELESKNYDLSGGDYDFTTFIIDDKLFLLVN